MQEEDGATSCTEGVTIGHLICKANDALLNLVHQETQLQSNWLGEQVQPFATYQKI